MSDDEAILVEPVGGNDHIQGNPSAQVTLLEYGDYECPYCGEAYGVLKEVQKHMGATIRFVFRNFPLREMHPHAMKAAEAAEAAGAQGKFWEMHDMLYENQESLAIEDLRGYAKALGLDSAKFDHALEAGTYKAKIMHDFKTGVMSGVNGTPTLFINDERYEDERDVPTLVKYLKMAAQAAQPKSRARAGK
jgi:protein-disulfide isomerase